MKVDPDKASDRLQSIFSLCSDISRWVLLSALSKRISQDRKRDMEHAAERILKLIREIE